jgi:hypothetical protein
VEHNNQKSVYFPNTTPGVPYVRSHSDRNWRSKGYVWCHSCCSQRLTGCCTLHHTRSEAWEVTSIVAAWIFYLNFHWHVDGYGKQVSSDDPIRKRLGGVRSGDFGGYSIVTQRTAHKPRKKYDQFWTSSAKLVGAAFCKTGVVLWVLFRPDKIPGHHSTTGAIVRRLLALPGVFPWILHHTFIHGLVRWRASLRREDFSAPSVQSCVN